MNILSGLLGQLLLEYDSSRLAPPRNSPSEQLEWDMVDNHQESLVLDMDFFVEIIFSDKLCTFYVFEYDNASQYRITWFFSPAASTLK